jgi:hypothetical protein
MMGSETMTYLEMKGTTMAMKMATSTKTIILTQFSNSRMEAPTISMMSLLLALKMKRRRDLMTMILIIERVKRLALKSINRFTFLLRA